MVMIIEYHKYMEVWTYKSWPDSTELPLGGGGGAVWRLEEQI